MIGTLFSFFIALLLYFEVVPKEPIPNAPTLAMLLFFIATLLIITQTVITLYAWIPLQRAEQNITPHIIKTFREDRNLKLTNLILLVFLFFTYTIVVDVLFLGIFNKQSLFIIWTLLLGVAVDLLHHHMKRTLNFLDPYHVLNVFGKSAQDCIREAKEEELCEWIDTFSEIGIKAIAKNSSSLASLAVENLQLITKNYLEAAKSIAYHSEKPEKNFGGSEHIGYTLFYLFQRLELLFDKALEQSLEPLCSQIVTVLGKISLYGAKCDISLTNYPLFYLGKLTTKAQRKGMHEVGARASITLMEVGRLIIKDVDLQYLEIKEPFTTLINTLQAIAKDTFRNDKSVSIRVLMQPLEDLRALFQSEKLVNHPDNPAIVQMINLVLGEFSALESVMSTMPPVAEILKSEPLPEEEPLNKEE